MTHSSFSEKICADEILVDRLFDKTIATKLFVQKIPLSSPFGKGGKRGI
jgi:hypothetical protein